jgi:hypothetical protein
VKPLSSVIFRNELRLTSSDALLLSLNAVNITVLYSGHNSKPRKVSKGSVAAILLIPLAAELISGSQYAFQLERYLATVTTTLRDQVRSEVLSGMNTQTCVLTRDSLVDGRQCFGLISVIRHHGRRNWDCCLGALVLWYLPTEKFETSFYFQKTRRNSVTNLRLLELFSRIVAICVENMTKPVRKVCYRKGLVFNKQINYVHRSHISS